MSKGILWVVVSSLMTLSLLMAACGPAPLSEEKAEPKQAPAPVTGETEKKQQVAAPAEPERLITVTLKKVDGTPVVKQFEKPKYGGTYNRNLAQTGIWDPRLQRASDQSYVIAQERLLVGDYARGPLGTGEVNFDIYEYLSMSFFRGSLAESWELPDDETVIYHIRHGVRWALDSREASKLVNGREVTADDVVFSFKWLVFAAKPSVTAGYFAGVKLSDIYVKDKYTVVIKGPKQDLAQALGYLSDLIVIVPREVIEKYGTFARWDQIVGTGPFMIKDYVPSATTTWVKNTTYWGYDPILGKDYPLPYVDVIRDLNIPDASTRQAALRTGKIDDAVSMTKEEQELNLKIAPHIKTKVVAFGTGSSRIALQMNDPKAPWQDIRVRRALLMGINHQEIVDSYYDGAADLQAFPLPGAPELFAMGWAIPMKDLPRETQELFEYHPDKAKQLLKEAGYPNGFKTSVILTSGQVDTLAIIKDYWAKIGVDLSLDVRETSSVNSYIVAANYPQMLYTGGWGTTLLYPRYSKPPASNNEGNVDDAYMQELRRKVFDVLWDTEKRTPIMAELYRYSLSSAYYLPLPSPWSYRMYQPWLKNYDAESSIGFWGKSFPYVWIDQDLKKKLGF